jgi:hypothetical protein
MLSDLMFAQLDSEGRLLKFDIGREDSSDFFKEIETLPKLIFFHSELSCNVCVEDNLALINDFCNDVGSANVLFLASYNNRRDLHLFRTLNQIASYVYNVKSVGLPAERLNLPFCFIINDGYKAESVFIPLVHDKNVTFIIYLIINKIITF